MDEKRKHDSVSRVWLAAALIIVGIIFLMANIGFYSLDNIGQFFGSFGRSIGEFFGDLGREFGRSAANLWPLILIVLGLALVMRHPTDKPKTNRIHSNNISHE